MIDWASDFGLLNSLVSAAWITVIPAFGLSLECLMYQVNARSCRALTNVAFLILSYVTSYASHTAFTTNQNWSRSSFPTPLNTGNFIEFNILKCVGGEGGTDEDGGDDGETSGGLGGGGMRRILCLIKWIALCRDTFASSSLSPHKGEIKVLVSSPTLPSFL